MIDTIAARWNAQGKVKRAIVSTVGILAGWVLFGFAIGMSDHNFRPWRGQLLRWVVMTDPLVAGYWKVAGPYKLTAEAPCQRLAIKLGPRAYCVAIRTDLGEALPPATPQMLAGSHVPVPR